MIIPVRNRVGGLACGVAAVHPGRQQAVCQRQSRVGVHVLLAELDQVHRGVDPLGVEALEHDALECLQCARPHFVDVCKSEQQHVVILVQCKGLSQLDGA